VRLEPIILELEREQNDLLIIAHESVLRVLYAYLMHCSTTDIPSLKFPRDEIIEISPAAYQNEAKRLKIPGLEPSLASSLAPNSPEGVKILVPGGSAPASGHLSPVPTGVVSPIEPLEVVSSTVNSSKDMVADKVDDED
jgi:6-phosphofructo-2-kinase/fructose-2,6-biphosphatase 4